MNTLAEQTQLLKMLNEVEPTQVQIIKQGDTTTLTFEKGTYTVDITKCADFGHIQQVDCYNDSDSDDLICVSVGEREHEDFIEKVYFECKEIEGYNDVSDWKQKANESYVNDIMGLLK